MIKIIQPSESIEVKQVTTMLYGPTDCGKTTIAMTATRPLLIDIERGVHRAYDRRCPCLQIDSFGDFQDIKDSDFSDFDTIVIDTLGALIDSCSDFIVRDPKCGSALGLNLKGWGKLKGQLTSLHKRFLGLGKDLVYLVHSKEKSGNDGQILHRIDASGSFASDLAKTVEVMGRMYKIGEQTHIKFVSDDVGPGKIPRSLGINEVPVPHIVDSPNFLGDLIRDAKAAMNALSEKQKERTKEVDEIAAKIDSAYSADELTTIALSIKDSVREDVQTVARALVLSRAEDLSFSWDKEGRKFVEANEE